MFILFSIIIILAAVLLVFAVLMQESKQGSSATSFGGSSTSQLIGVTKTADFLERLTWGLAFVIATLAIASSLWQIRQRKAQFESPNLKRVQDEPAALDDKTEKADGAGSNQEQENNAPQEEAQTPATDSNPADQEKQDS